MATTSNRLIFRWRNDFVKAMENFRSDMPPEEWADVYIPQGHLKALHPQSMLIEGMRGSGKSFWSRVFTQPHLRHALSQSAIDGWLKDELALITDCKGILWDKTDNSTSLPNKASVKNWLDSSSFDPMLFWAVIVLCQFPIDDALGMPEGDIYDKWTARIQWAQVNPERVMSALHLCNEKQSSKAEQILVVIDGFDVVSTKFSHTQALMRGIFQLLLEFRYAKGLRFKVFVREDILKASETAVSDASKLINEKVTLDWKPSDLFGLVFHFLAQQSSYFRNRFEIETGQKFKRYAAGTSSRFEHPSLTTVETQEKMWKWLAGPFMGSTPTKGHTYSWIIKHLEDGKSRISPRTFLNAVKVSLEETASNSKYSEHSLVIHHEAIREGVRRASQDRVEELNDEYLWVHKALGILKLKSKTVPINWSELLAVWKEGNKQFQDVISVVEKTAEQTLIPWDMDVNLSLDDKAIHLLETMINIGVFQLRERQNVKRVDLPDIYRLGYRIGRNGGIAVQKKK